MLQCKKNVLCTPDSDHVSQYGGWASKSLHRLMCHKKGPVSSLTGPAFATETSTDPAAGYFWVTSTSTSPVAVAPSSSSIE